MTPQEIQTEVEYLTPVLHALSARYPNPNEFGTIFGYATLHLFRIIADTCKGEREETTRNYINFLRQANEAMLQGEENKKQLN